jgi:hypothetical protein
MCERWQILHADIGLATVKAEQICLFVGLKPAGVKINLCIVQEIDKLRATAQIVIDKVHALHIY